MTESAPIQCPVCGGADWSQDAIAGRILALPPGYWVLVCSGCGQRRMHPQLTVAAIENLYSGAYFGSQPATVPDLPPIKAAEADYGEEVVRERRAKFARTLRRIVALEPGVRTVLDVGAATGDFVRIALDQGFAAEGIETSEYATEKASEVNGVALQCCTLDEVRGEARYDCIHLNHVFEHFNDPVRELAHLRRLLRAGGLLYLEIPYQFQAIEKLLFRLRGGTPDFTLHSLHHPFFYTPSTISRIVAANGFEVVALSVFDAERYEPTTLLGGLKKRLWQVCAAASIGNYIELWARRRA